jgi:hypothetical protein
VHCQIFGSNITSKDLFQTSTVHVKVWREKAAASLHNLCRTIIEFVQRIANSSNENTLTTGDPVHSKVAPCCLSSWLTISKQSIYTHVLVCIENLEVSDCSLATFETTYTSARRPQYSAQQAFKTLYISEYIHTLPFHALIVVLKRQCSIRL